MVRRHAWKTETMNDHQAIVDLTVAYTWALDTKQVEFLSLDPAHWTT